MQGEQQSRNSTWFWPGTVIASLLACFAATAAADDLAVPTIKESLQITEPAAAKPRQPVQRVRPVVYQPAARGPQPLNQNVVFERSAQTPFAPVAAVIRPVAVQYAAPRQLQGFPGMAARPLMPVVARPVVPAGQRQVSFQQPQQVFYGHPAAAYPQPSVSPVEAFGCADCSPQLTERPRGGQPWYRRFKSDHAFDDFIEPVTNPFWFVDPRPMTRVRAVFLNQFIPDDSILGDGDLQVYALQGSIRVSDRFSLLAEKDGWNSLQTVGTGGRRGWNDLATGFRYTFIRDVPEQFLVSGGVIYEHTQGSREVFQGNGNGIWNLYLSTGKRLCSNTHFIGVAGASLPSDNSESQSFYYSLHVDYRLSQRWWLLWELNGRRYTESGDFLAANVEGGDWTNLGANNVSGNDFVSTAFGATARISRRLALHAAFEFPLGREDLMENRLNVQMSWTY